jgi:hypothetical protein
MGRLRQRCGGDAVDLSKRQKTGVALIVVGVMMGTAVTAVTVAPAFGRPTSASFSMSIEIVPWHENEPFWVWIPVMLQDRSPNWLQFSIQPQNSWVDWHMVNGSEGSWLNVTGNHSVSIGTWATVEDVSRATGLQWSALSPGPQGATRLLFAAGGESTGPIGVRLTAVYRVGSSPCSDVGVASEMVPANGGLRVVDLEVEPAC